MPGASDKPESTLQGWVRIDLFQDKMKKTQKMLLKVNDLVYKKDKMVYVNKTYNESSVAVPREDI